MEPEEKNTAMETEKKKLNKKGVTVPDLEQIEAALSRVESVDDFFGKEGILAQLFARTLEQMREGE